MSTDTTPTDTPKPVTDPADPAFLMGPEAEARSEKAGKLRDALTAAAAKLRAAADWVQFLGDSRASKKDAQENTGTLISDAQAKLDEAIGLIPDEDAAPEPTTP